MYSPHSQQSFQKGPNSMWFSRSRELMAPSALWEFTRTHRPTAQPPWLRSDALEYHRYCPFQTRTRRMRFVLQALRSNRRCQGPGFNGANSLAANYKIFQSLNDEGPLGRGHVGQPIGYAEGLVRYLLNHPVEVGVEVRGSRLVLRDTVNGSVSTRLRVTDPPAAVDRMISG